MGEFIVTTREDIDKLVEKRKGETRIGETIQTIIIQTGKLLWQKVLPGLFCSEYLKI